MFISQLTLSKLFCQADSKFSPKDGQTKKKSSRRREISADSDVCMHL